jgi:hypothetical protein
MVVIQYKHIVIQYYIFKNGTCANAIFAISNVIKIEF